jgi:molybdenum cofactor cytidylyltransferase
MNEIWAIILAAGESKRMGFPKMMLDFNGMTLLENVICTVRDSDVNDMFVVLGAWRESILEIISKHGVNYCYNASYRNGMLSSVQCGFRNVPLDAEAVFVFQGDQPLITSSTVNSLIKAFRTSPEDIVVPVHESKRGHPILIGRRYRDEIDSLNAGIGLRELTLNHPDEVLEVDTGDPGILRDFDTYEEYIKEINKFS